MKKREEKKGIYYKKLSKDLALIFAIISILIFSIFPVFYMYFSKRDFQNLESNIGNQFNIINSTESLILSSYNSLKNNPNLELLVENSNNSQKYYYSSKIIDQLKSNSNQFASLSYSMAVILDPMLYDFTITPNGTSTNSWYFNNETRLTKKQIDQFYNHFEHSNDSLFITNYDKNNNISDLYIFKEIQLFSQNKVIIATHVFVFDFFNSNKGLTFIANSNNKILASRNTKISKNFIKNNFNLFKNDGFENLEIINFNQIIFKKYFTDPNWVYIYKIDRSPIFLSPILIFIIVFSLLILIVFRYFFSREKEILYRPINEIVNLSKDIGDISNSEIDEFKFLKLNGEKIKVLKEELEDALKKNSSLLSINDAISLLNGNINSKNTDKKSYFVVFLKYLNIEEEIEETIKSISLNPFVSNSSITDDKKISFILLNDCESCLIIENDNFDIVYEKVVSIINETKEDLEIVIAISDKVVGSRNIQFAYKQAKNIIDFSNAFPSNVILTSKLVSRIYDNYYYPLNMESRLINLVVNGKNESKKLINEIIDDNINVKKLSLKTKINFTYALISTLQRIFQEIKISPERLLGRSITWNHLYNESSNLNTLTYIHDLFFEICDKIQDISNSSENKIFIQSKEYIEKNYYLDISLQDIANKLNISPKYCSLIFSKCSNTTFKDYLNRYRINCAKQILRENPLIKVKVLSEKVGFNSSTSFIRVFKKYCGISPKLYAASSLR